MIRLLDPAEFIKIACPFKFTGRDARAILIRNRDLWYAIVKRYEGNPTFRFSHGTKLIMLCEAPPVMLVECLLGGSAATMQLEELSAIGVHTALFMGTCCSIRPDFGACSLLVPHTVYFDTCNTGGYSEAEIFGQMTPRLTENIVCTLKDSGYFIVRAILTSTSSPYLLHQGVLNQWLELRIDAFDMELASLCAAATVMKLDFSAVIIVGDFLNPKTNVWSNWHRDLSTKVEKLVTVVEHLANILVKVRS